MINVLLIEIPGRFCNVCYKEGELSQSGVSWIIFAVRLGTFIYLPCLCLLQLHCQVTLSVYASASIEQDQKIRIDTSFLSSTLFFIFL